MDTHNDTLRAHPESGADNGSLSRRHFMGTAAALAGAVSAKPLWGAAPESDPLERLAPLGEAKGVRPGRVVWVHDPHVLDWQGPGHGHWWQPEHLSQDRADAMMQHAVCELAGAATPAEAWARLFRHFNAAGGRGDTGYRKGEKVAVKPNWVGLIWRVPNVDPETYALTRQIDYMNTAPQLLVALLRQLTGEAGVRPADITVSDTLANLANEYYDIMHGEFPQVRYEDHAGKFGRAAVTPSDVPFHWSCRPEGVRQDRVPTCFAEATYLVNFANLKAHMGSGVTLCAKNHLGSLVRWPVEEGYYNMHPGCFAKETGVYRTLVDLMGHAHLGGKTVLHLIDGLFSGVHPRDAEPKPMQVPPFDGQWPCSLLASQDAVAVDSVAFDFLWADRDDFPRQPGADDYLHEAALAGDPPSGTFYDPDHATATRRLGSLGVHEHWNNAEQKQYSRNLGTGRGIELIPVML